MYWTDANLARLARVESLAQEWGEPPAAVALVWLLNQSFPVSPIIGASSVEQLAESWRVTATNLSPMWCPGWPTGRTEPGVRGLP